MAPQGNVSTNVAIKTLPFVAFCSHDDVIKWKKIPYYWPFVRGIHRGPVNSPHKGQWRGALMFSLICALNKRLTKQWWSWWFETPSCSLWRHCNVSKSVRLAYYLLDCGSEHMSQCNNTVYMASAWIVLCFCSVCLMQMTHLFLSQFLQIINGVVTDIGYEIRCRD